MGSIAEQVRQCEDKIRNLHAEAERLKFRLAVEEEVLSRLEMVRESIGGNGSNSAKAPGSLASRIEEALLASGKPMSVSEITMALERAGVTSESPDGLKPSVASAISRRKDLFVRVGKGSHDLAARQKSTSTQGNESK
jgi:aspartokinase